ncbi:IBR finger domain protein [Dactylonectria estremocensis]|uniref:IBR finger domain protein n=1 Tax=Dactylonectria estremocensis TaxID=1079267 RepID=A0A9P9JIW4_9HYPO|nr:IBR finger domain protein [Dactylonectria estremocensis]
MASKRSILITGCSDGGLGSTLALTFHKTGWRVFASARNMSKLKQIEGTGIETIQLDIKSDESIRGSVAKIEELTGGSLDALLNNAGAGYCMPLMDVDICKARELFEINVFPLLSMTQSFLPLLMKSTRGPMVINNTSIASVTIGGLPFHGTYNASKAAAASLTEAIRLELAPFGIKVINLMTGAVGSNFFDNAPNATLPPNSLYNLAKEPIEKFMAGGDGTNMDRFKWAEQVVKNLEKPNPPFWVWQGRYAKELRIGALLPVGFLDSFVKPMVGLDVLERKIQEQEKESKKRAS